MHTHPCSDCKTPVECAGEWEPNHDGFPEVICPHYHLPSGRLATMRCEACEAEDAA
jgi:hypothetical protein